MKEADPPPGRARSHARLLAVSSQRSRAAPRPDRRRRPGSHRHRLAARPHRRVRHPAALPARSLPVHVRLLRPRTASVRRRRLQADPGGESGAGLPDHLRGGRRRAAAPGCGVSARPLLDARERWRPAGRGGPPDQVRDRNAARQALPEVGGAGAGRGPAGFSTPADGGATCPGASWTGQFRDTPTRPRASWHAREGGAGSPRAVPTRRHLRTAGPAEAALRPGPARPRAALGGRGSSARARVGSADRAPREAQVRRDVAAAPERAPEQGPPPHPGPRQARGLGTRRSPMHVRERGGASVRGAEASRVRPRRGGCPWRWG
jgi:hypothetical protein